MRAGAVEVGRGEFVFIKENDDRWGGRSDIIDMEPSCGGAHTPPKRICLEMVRCDIKRYHIAGNN